MSVIHLNIINNNICFSFDDCQYLYKRVNSAILHYDELDRPDVDRLFRMENMVDQGTLDKDIPCGYTKMRRTDISRRSIKEN